MLFITNLAETLSTILTYTLASLAISVIYTLHVGSSSRKNLAILEPLFILLGYFLCISFRNCFGRVFSLL